MVLCSHGGRMSAMLAGICNIAAASAAEARPTAVEAAQLASTFL